MRDYTQRYIDGVRLTRADVINAAITAFGSLDRVEINDSSYRVHQIKLLFLDKAVEVKFDGVEPVYWIQLSVETDKVNDLKNAIGSFYRTLAAHLRGLSDTDEIRQKLGEWRPIWDGSKVPNLTATTATFTKN